MKNKKTGKYKKKTIIIHNVTLRKLYMLYIKHKIDFLKYKIIKFTKYHKINFPVSVDR